MGASVKNSVNTEKYFSISTIDKNVMEKLGLKMTIQELRAVARSSPPAFEIMTGTEEYPGRIRKTKIYRYSDFLEGNLKDTEVENAKAKKVN